MACNFLQAFILLTFSIAFWLLGDYLCVLTLLLITVLFPLQWIPNVPYTYVKIMLFYRFSKDFCVGFYPFLLVFYIGGSPSTPIPPRFSLIFIYTFGKELKRGGDGHGGVRGRHFPNHSLPNTFSIYYIQFSF
jgi:hypothetical protein